MDIISRKEAKAFGLKRYFTGKPCKHGHTEERRVHDGACCECQRNAYRVYAAENAEKETERKRAYMVSWREQLDDESRELFHKQHYDKYADQYRVRAGVRHQRCKTATPPWVDMNEIKAFYANRPAGYHVDHIIPLKGLMPDGNRVSGLNVPWNLQYLLAEDNHKKMNKVQQHDLNEIV